MSSKKVFKDRRAFGKISAPPAMMAIVNAASGQKVSFKPSHCRRCRCWKIIPTFQREMGRVEYGPRPMVFRPSGPRPR